MSIRSVLLVLLAISAIAGDAAAVSAKPNNGSFKKSSEAFKRAHAENCKAAYDTLVSEQDEAERLAEQGKMRESREHSRGADLAWDYAASKGCAFTR